MLFFSPNIKGSGLKSAGELYSFEMLWLTYEIQIEARRHFQIFHGGGFIFPKWSAFIQAKATLCPTMATSYSTFLWVHAVKEALLFVCCGSHIMSVCLSPSEPVSLCIIISVSHFPFRQNNSWYWLLFLLWLKVITPQHWREGRNRRSLFQTAPLWAAFECTHKTLYAPCQAFFCVFMFESVCPYWTLCCCQKFH